MIPLFKPYISQAAINNVETTLRSGYIAQGPQVDKLEGLLRDELCSNNIVTVNSCTSALFLAYKLIKENFRLADDAEVLTSPVTCAATNLPILHNNLRIKWCDVDIHTCNIDLKDVKDKLSDRTRILTVVHWGGYPVDLHAIQRVKELYKDIYERELIVVHDMAHSFGSKFRRSEFAPICHNDYLCFSHQAIKALSFGDGGTLITPDYAYKQARKLRWFGIDRDLGGSFRHSYNIQDAGYKLHLNDIAASIGIGNLYSVNNAVIKRQKENAAYLEYNITNPRIKKPPTNDDTFSSAYWLYTIQVEDNNHFIEYMKGRDIEANPVHTRNDKCDVFKEFRTQLDNVSFLEGRRCCIPNGWFLQPIDLEKIVKACNEYEA